MEYQYIVCELDTQTMGFIAANIVFINENRVLNCKSIELPAIHSEISEQWICTQFFCVFVSNSENEISAITANCTVIDSFNIDKFNNKYVGA